jgi:phospholipid/cholesterol/gamma-HCH transport system substrate-binding protein
MDKSRLEWKVGLFVCIGLVLLAILLIQFSKGASFFRPGYNILLRAQTVGGLKVRAQVLMSGIQVGSVANMQLGPAGTNVIITLRIYQQYKIYKDARFAIEQSGFLGDQYVAILPTKNEGPVYGPGETAEVEPPLDLQEVAREATELLGQIGSAAKKINRTLTNAQNTVLSEETFTNLAATVSNFHRISDRSLTVVEGVRSLVESNRESLTSSISNLQVFSRQAGQVASRLDELLATNAPAISMTVSNIEHSSATLDGLIDTVPRGTNVVGKLFADRRLAADMSEMAHYLSITSSNLSITSSNLNRLGLWGILWQHKPRKPVPPPSEQHPLTSPKNPFGD